MSELVRNSPAKFRRPSLLALTVCLSFTMLIFSLFGNWWNLLQAIGFGIKLGPRGQNDLLVFQALGAATSLFVMVASIAIWRFPTGIVTAAHYLSRAREAVESLPGLAPLSLTTVLALKTAIQLVLPLLGYQAFSGDDFARSLKADYWLYHDTFDVVVDGWFGHGKFSFLPFPDYVFGLALAVYRDIYITPKVVNLVISGVTLIVVYLLGRELFGKAVGLLAAVLFAFIPWQVWLGISGMTSDSLSILLIVLATLCLLRWFERDQPLWAVVAGACLFGANGSRFENWLTSAIIGLVFVFVTAKRWRQRRLARGELPLMAIAISLTAAFPILWIVACYLESGHWLPAISNEHFTHDTGTSLFPIHYLLLSSFPLELLFALGGIGLFLKLDKRKPARLVLAISLASFLLFIAVTRGQVVKVGGVSRYFLPYIISLLPFTGFFFARLPGVLSAMRREYSIVACTAVIILMLTFNIMRSFNYPEPAREEAIATGMMLRQLQDLRTLPQNGKILLEREEAGKRFDFVAIVVIANRPERFSPVHTKELESLCGGRLVAACRSYIVANKFDVAVVASPEVMTAIRTSFEVGRSWELGRYAILALNDTSASTRN